MKSSSDEHAVAIDGCLFRVVNAERVAAVCERMPAEEDLVDTADVFGLLSDPRRLRLLLALLDGELCVCDLAAVTGMSESATSHALRLLRAHRVVTARRDGRMMYYRLDDAHVRMLLDLAMAHTEHTEAIHPERSSAVPDGSAVAVGSAAAARPDGSAVPDSSAVAAGSAGAAKPDGSAKRGSR